MEDLKIPKFANILSNDPTAVKNWRQIYDNLKLPPASAVTLTKFFDNGKISSYDLFTEILENWKSSNGKVATAKKIETVVRDLGFKDAADKIERHRITQIGPHNLESYENSKTNEFELDFPLKYNYNGLVSYYVQREYLENNIIANLKEEGEKSHRISFPVVVLYGIGGNGKTTLASRIIQIWHEENHLEHNSIWIDAEMENSIQSQFSSMFKTLYNNDSNQVQEKMQEVYKTVFKTRSCLIVFDNVDNYEMILKFLPLNLDSKVSVLITSNQEWEAGDYGQVTHFRVENFSETEFSNYIQKRIPGISEFDVEHLGNYTTRIPYLTNIVVSGYNSWKKPRPNGTLLEYLDLKDDAIIGGAKPKNSKFIVYQHKPQQIVERQVLIMKENFDEGNLAWKILCIIAFCEAEIYEQHFLGFISYLEYEPDAERNDDEDFGQTLKAAINILIDQGFLQRRSGDFEDYSEEEEERDISYALSIHRSHQHAVQLILQSQQTEEKQIQEIIANWDPKYLYVPKYSFFITVALTHGEQILQTIIDSNKFLEFLETYRSHESILATMSYAKSRRSKKRLILWIFSTEYPFRGNLIYNNRHYDKNQLQLLTEYINLVKTYYEEVIEEPEERSWIENELFEIISHKHEFRLIYPEYYMGCSIWPSGESKLDNLIAILKAVPALINRKINSEQYFIHFAVHYRNIKFLNFLIGNGANLDELNVQEETPLFLAASYGVVDLVEELLKAGADPNKIKINGDCLLHLLAKKAGWIVWNQNKKIMELLLSHGADVKIKNKDGKIPFDIARESRDIDMMKAIPHEWSDEDREIEKKSIIFRQFFTSLLRLARSPPLPFYIIKVPHNEETTTSTKKCSQNKEP